MMGIDYSIYVSKYDYMPIRVHQGAFDNQNNITDFEYDYNVDMKVFQFPDLLCKHAIIA